MNDQTASFIRSLLKLGAGALVAHGYLKDSGAEEITAGVMALIGLAFSFVHHANNPTNPPGPKIGLLFLAGLLALSPLTGCKTALMSDKIISVKQRSFGIIVGQSPSTQTPEVHLGFVSTVWEMIPTSTNGPISAPLFMDTFELSQGLNPFGTGINENTGSGSITLGTNGEASAFPPK